MSNGIESVGKAIGTAIGLRDPAKEQKKALKRAEEEARRQQEEQTARRQSVQRASLAPRDSSLFDILRGSGL